MRSFPEAGIPPFLLQRLRPGYVGETLGFHTRGTLAANSSLPARLPACHAALRYSPAANCFGLPVLLRFKLNQPGAVFSRLDVAESHWHLMWLGV